MKSIKEEATVYHSKARPKKITVVGSDNLLYSFLVKFENRGDLRKDAHVMECLEAVNRLMKRESSNYTQNELKSYMVTPLSLHGGIIEMVEDVTPLR